MRRAGVAVTLVSAGCLEPMVVPCGALVCPADQACVDDTRCVDRALLEACAGLGAGERCTFGPLEGSCQAGVCELPVCGDGVRQALEACEDGNIVNGDGCNSACVLETCGNGVIDAGEPCDCGTAATPGDPDVCGAELNGGAICQTTCTLPRCGDSVLDPGEACDDGNRMDDDGCSRSCDSDETCGNGVRDVGEECDDGNRVDHDGCQSSCVIQRCGDGIVDAAAGEGCDDGDLDSNDACLATCVPASCGDGILHVGVEACDDGNESNEDGCLACVQATCGDGWVEHGVEQCDDGNTQQTDACLNSCEFNQCGDGIRNFESEQCDDGNREDGDGCDHHCQVTCTAGSTCYVVLPEPGPWELAADRCLHQLPNGLGPAIVQNGLDNAKVVAALEGRDGWLGINKAPTGKWWDGTPIGFSVWLADEPHGDFGAIQGSDGSWFTRSPGEPLYAVCLVQ
jgi:cysteine-rich repeat protein